MTRLAESLLALVLLLSAAVCQAELTPGCVLLSRNRDEQLNTSIGHINHLSIVATNGDIIEAQEGQGVIRTPLEDFLKRDYEPVQVMRPCDAAVGEKAAKRAEQLVGLKFRKFSSVFRRQRRGTNCVGVIKHAYFAEPRVRSIKIPDHVLRLTGLFDAPQPLGTPIPPAPSPAERSLLVRHATVFSETLNVTGRPFRQSCGWYTYEPYGSNNEGMLLDVLSRCDDADYLRNKYRGDVVTQCHEGTHFVNNQICNSLGHQAFYVGRGYCFILPEPRLTLVHVARLVPHRYRDRIYYPLYFQQMTNPKFGNLDRPLYVLDEFSAAVNGWQCAIQEQVSDTGDATMSRLFCHYADALIEAVKRHDRSYGHLSQLVSFVDYQKQRVAMLSDE
jgi:hypothetical protein